MPILQEFNEIAKKKNADTCSLKYVLITPARNEEKYLDKTIKSVVQQTNPPLKWIIVSDGSTDATDDIVRSYTEEYSWIQLVRMPEHRDRNFAAKVTCFNAGLKQLEQLNYDIIGNLDADISFEIDYFEYLLAKFAIDPQLGAAGTPFIEGSFSYDYRFVNIEHVSGACQLFSRKCFEDIGGYQPIKGGGIDWVAVTTARMKGWKTRTFTEKYCIHHRKIGSGKSSIISAKYRFGKQDFYLGSHPLWEIIRCFYQMKFRPFVIGGLAIYIGYLEAFITGEPYRISAKLINFRRKEQMYRLKKIVKRLFGNVQFNHRNESVSQNKF